MTCFLLGSPAIIRFSTVHKLGQGQHIILNHSKQFSKEQEAEADYVGILLCKKHNEKKALKLGIENFKSRNNLSFKKYHSKNYRNIINNTLISHFI